VQEVKGTRVFALDLSHWSTFNGRVGEQRWALEVAVLRPIKLLHVFYDK